MIIIINDTWFILILWKDTVVLFINCFSFCTLNSLSWYKLDWNLRWSQQYNCQMCPASFCETLLLTCLLSHQQRTPCLFFFWIYCTAVSPAGVASRSVSMEGRLHPGAPAGCKYYSSVALFTSALTVSDKCSLHMSYLQIDVKTLLIFHHWDSLLQWTDWKNWTQVLTKRLTKLV